MAEVADLRLFGGTKFSQVGARRAVSAPCKCASIPRGSIMAPQFSTTGGVGDGSESFGVKPRNMWPESMSDGTDAVTNSGIISKKVQQFYGAQRSDIQGQLMSPQAVQEIPGVMAAFGKTTQILKYPSGVVTSSVFLDKRTLNYSYGIV